MGGGHPIQFARHTNESPNMRMDVQGTEEAKNGVQKSARNEKKEEQPYVWLGFDVVWRP